MKIHVECRRPAGVLLILAAMGGMAAAGVRVPLEKVPPAAVKLVKDRFAKALIRFVDKEGSGHYEFAMQEGDRQYDVGVTALGKLLSVKEELPEEKLPAAVREGVQKKYPGGKVVEAEKITKAEDAAARTTYELLIKTDMGSHSLELDGTGKVVGEGD